MLGLPSFEDTAPYMYAVLIVMANGMFLFYDLLLSRMGWFYHRVFVRKVLRRR